MIFVWAFFYLIKLNVELWYILVIYLNKIMIHFCKKNKTQKSLNIINFNFKIKKYFNIKKYIYI